MKTNSWNIRKVKNGFVIGVFEEDPYSQNEYIFLKASDVYGWLSDNGLTD